MLKVKGPYQHKEEQPLVLPEDIEVRYLLGTVGQTLKEYFGSFEKDKAYLFFSAGRWSAHELLAYLLKQTGPSKVYLTTYAMSERATRLFIDMMDRGLITELHALFDERQRANSENVLAQAGHSFTSIGQAPCHAKTTVVINEYSGITVVGSANFSNNRRIEGGTIFTRKTIAETTADWIIRQINGEKPLGR